MAAEKDFYKEMSNFDKIEQEDGWNDLVSQDKESAESFKHPHKPRLSETLPDRTVTGHANPQVHGCFTNSKRQFQLCKIEFRNFLSFSSRTFSFSKFEFARIVKTESTAAGDY